MRLGCDDDVLVEALPAAGKPGVNCPLGWPVRFVEFVAAHGAGPIG